MQVVIKWKAIADYYWKAALVRPHRTEDSKQLVFLKTSAWHSYSDIASTFHRHPPETPGFCGVMNVSGLIFPKNSLLLKQYKNVESKPWPYNTNLEKEKQRTHKTG